MILLWIILINREETRRCNIKEIILIQIKYDL